MFPLPRLYVICDAEVCERAGWPLVDYATACMDGGATLLQIRAKHMASGRFLEQVSRIVERSREAGAAIVVNDRADIARLANADGVHVGQDDLTPAAARQILDADAIVGWSTHTPAQVEQALREPITYLAIGPAFGTATKETGYEPVGLEQIRETVRRAAAHQLPVVAIGGITLDRAAAVLDAGATSVAVISDLVVTGDPRARVADFLRVLRGYNPARS